MTHAEGVYMGHVATLGCVICRRLGYGYVPAEIHHIAEGSSLRSNYAIASLCAEHHRGRTGVHGDGKVEGFCKRFRFIPWEKEEGLLVLVNEDMQLAQMGRLRMAAA